MPGVEKWAYRAKTFFMQGSGLTLISLIITPLLLIIFEMQQETMIASTEPVLSNPPSQWGDRNGSDGRFANPAVKKYDPSGLRSSMSATWGELDKALAEQAQADHLPSNNGKNWQAKQEALDAESERKGIPYVSGSNYRGYNNRPKNYTDCRW